MYETHGQVLVIDDEKVNCNVLVALLDDYKVIVAKNGEQALKRARANPPPDLILLDVVMPEMDGYEVCRSLKSDPLTQDIPIIFITVKATIEDEAEGLKMGAVDYISKPFSPAIVQARVANHMQLKKQRDILESLNVTDSLTNIANRRKFDRYMHHEWKTALRTSCPISLIIADIDNFKEYNDHYGHCAGDECLKAVAKALEEHADRDVDLVARYGGEEFGIVLPHTNLNGARYVADKMQAAIEALQIEHDYSTSGASIVTVSLGISTISAKADEGPKLLIERADKALYQAKKNGRNQVCEYRDVTEGK